MVVLDIESCLEYCEDLGDEVSIEYFQGLKDNGYKYVSLDGQNRTKHIQKVVESEVTISTELTVPDEPVYSAVNEFYKDLPFKVQHHIIKGCDIPVVLIGEATRQDAAKIFKSLNDGVTLNAQETRQSEPTPIADVVRQLSRLHNKATQRMLTSQKISRMEDDETIAKFLMVLFRKYRDAGEVVNREMNLGSDDIDDFYKMGVDFSNINDPDSPYLLTEINRAKAILRMFSAVILNVAKSGIIRKKNQWATLYACEWLYDNNYTIHNYSQFFDVLKEIDSDLQTSSLKDYTQDREDNIAKGLDPDDVTPSNYYFKWQTLPHHVSARNSAKAAITARMKQEQNRLTFRLKRDKFNQAA